jgi:hypothetical protein
MDIKIVTHKAFKKIYLNFFVLCCLLIAGGFILVQTGIRFFPAADWIVNLKNLFIYGMIGIVLLYTIYEQTQRRKLRSLDTFEEKISFFEQFYKKRLWWHVFACFTSILLLLLTYRRIFLYISFYDLFIMLSAYPSKIFLQREIQEDDLVFT